MLQNLAVLSVEQVTRVEGGITPPSPSDRLGYSCSEGKYCERKLRNSFFTSVLKLFCHAIEGGGEEGLHDG